MKNPFAKIWVMLDDVHIPRVIRVEITVDRRSESRGWSQVANSDVWSTSHGSIRYSLEEGLGRRDNARVVSLSNFARRRTIELYALNFILEYPVNKSLTPTSHTETHTHIHSMGTRANVFTCKYNHWWQGRVNKLYCSVTFSSWYTNSYFRLIITYP